MKRSIMTALALGIMLAATSSASAYSVTNGAINVGGLETFIARTNLSSSGDADEVNWVNNALENYYGGDFNFTVADLTKYNTPEGAGWQSTDQYSPTERVVAYHIATAPQYFYIKTGKLKLTGDYEHFLFANNANLDWAVLDLDDSFGQGYSVNGIGKFSHTGELGNPPTVPEPATMLLMGTGLVGLAGALRRRKRS